MLNVHQAGKGAGGISVENASSNNGDYFNKYPYNKGNNLTYGKGIARFGNGEDALYLHYDMYATPNYTTNLGGKNINNTISMRIFCDVVYKVTSDEGITLYPIRFIYSSDSIYNIIGRRKDGVWVKYIDADKISKTYFGKDASSIGVIGDPLICQGDTLILKYRKRRSRNAEGEFRFKWDEVAQWFSVEQVIY